MHQLPIYHISPMLLRFFRAWLHDESSMGSENIYQVIISERDLFSPFCINKLNRRITNIISDTTKYSTNLMSKCLKLWKLKYTLTTQLNGTISCTFSCTSLVLIYLKDTNYLNYTQKTQL